MQMEAGVNQISRRRARPAPLPTQRWSRSKTRTGHRLQLILSMPAYLFIEPLVEEVPLSFGFNRGGCSGKCGSPSARKLHALNAGALTAQVPIPATKLISDQSAPSPPHRSASWHLSYKHIRATAAFECWCVVHIRGQGTH